MAELRTTRIFSENQFGSANIYLNRGGTRSSKTYSLVQLAVLWLMNGKATNETHVWSICRKTFPALRATAYRDFQEITTSLGLRNVIQENRTTFEFRFGDRLVEFISLDEEQKIRSRKRDHLHICEANEIPHATFIQLAIRTKGRIYLDWNPDDSEHWIRRELEDKRQATKGDVKVIVSTYKDNPFLTPKEVEEIEYLKDVDPALWEVYGTGEYGTIRDTIYPNFSVEEWREDEVEQRFIGIDFGYSFSPAAVILVGKAGNTLYLKEVVYETKLTNQELAMKIKEAGYGNLACVADSAEPKSINDLQIYGLNVAAAQKGTDSVRNGIMYVKQFNIVAHPSSVNLVKELRAYKWAENKAGVPINAFDHLLDAMRYVVTKYMRQGQRIEFGGVVSGTKKWEVKIFSYFSTMGRRSKLVIEVDKIIEAAVSKFAAESKKSGNNLYLKLVPVIESLPVDADGNLLPVIATGAVQDAIVEAFDSASFNRRIDQLKPPLEAIDKVTKRDFARRNGPIEDFALEQVRGITSEYKRMIDLSFEDLDLDSGLVGPIMTSFRSAKTIPQLKSDLKQRIPDTVVNFTTFRSDNLYDQYSRSIADTYAASFGLVWARYEAVKDDRNRDFCAHRVEKYWHKSEVEQWGTYNWEGRIPGTNPTNVAELLGGYSCRHQLAWVKTSAVPDAVIAAWYNGRPNNKGTI